MAREETGTRKQARSAPTVSGPEDSAGSTATEAEDAQRQADTHTLLLRMAGRPAGEVLARISDGDMLRLFPRCARRIREACYVLDPERVYERALAEVAVSLEVDGERCAEEAWLSACVDRAVQSVLERDQREEHEGVPSLQPEKHYPLFIEACQLEPGLARLASVRFNALAPRVRRGFQKLVVEGLPLAEVLALDLGPPEQLQLDILHALQAIGLVDEAGVEELRVKGDQP